MNLLPQEMQVTPSSPLDKMPANWLPKITVIIAARPAQGQIKAVAAAQKLNYPAEKMEILIARGKQPSIQRNTALKAAVGELVYFLDDDSEPSSENLFRAVRHFADPKIALVGGPNVCPADASPLQQVFALVLGSWLAFSSSRARYTPVGAVRPSGEKELILCNLMGRKEPLIQSGGFDEALYPNEENALMDELKRRGSKLIYDPQFVVQRYPRATLTAFAKMLRTYGRGRAEQFRRHPTFGSAPNFAPPLFCLFLLALPFLGRPGLAVVMLYLFGLLLQVSALMAKTWRPLASLAAGPLIILSHILYGLGFWHGLFTRPGRKRAQQASEVVLEKLVLHP